MTAFVIKLLASVSMLIDHIGAVFPELALAALMRRVGRIAFPVYAYLAAQGSRRTGDINKYMLRLGIFALISEIPFDLAFTAYSGNPPGTINYLAYTNVFFTLFLAVAAINVYGRLIALQMDNQSIPPETVPFHMKLIAMAGVVPFVLLAGALDTDYGSYGVAYILLFYFMGTENRLRRTLAAVMVAFVEYGYPFFYGLAQSRGLGLPDLPGRLVYARDTLGPFLFACVAALLICLYNGKRGPKIQMPFYLFYPVHLAALAAVLYMTRYA